MKRVNIKNERAAEFLEQVVHMTDESKTDAVTHALESYLKLEASKRADAAIAYVREKIQPKIETSYLGCVPSKEEQEDLLEL